MATIKPSIKAFSCLEKIPVVLEKSYKMEAFFMGYHVYKDMWMPFVGEKLDTAMQPSNVRGKYVAAIFQERKKMVIGHFPLGKSGKSAKTVFYFLKATKRNRCKIIVPGKVVNQNDGLGMNVPSLQQKIINQYSKRKFRKLM